jgi:hypothetical protein
MLNPKPPPTFEGVTVIAELARDVATSVPVPADPMEQPVPHTSAALLFVPLVIPGKGIDVAAFVPVPVVPMEQPVPQSIAAPLFVPLVIAGNAADAAVILLNVGHAERLPETDCEAPVIVSVAEHDCGPVPSGGATPGEILTLNVH